MEYIEITAPFPFSAYKCFFSVNSDGQLMMLVFLHSSQMFFTKGLISYWPLALCLVKQTTVQAVPQKSI